MASKLTHFQKAHMEAILGPDSEPFQDFLCDHIESSEERDSEAKFLFNMMKQIDPESLALKLVNYLGPSYDIYARQECAELLHKLLNDDDLGTWRNLSISTQSTIKRIILDRLMLEEESKFIIKELRRTISKLAVSLIPDNNWPELLPFLYQCVSTSGSNNYLRKSAFWIFGTLAKDMGETVAPCIKTWQPLFQTARMDAILGPDPEPFETFLCDHIESSEEKDSEAKFMFNMMKQIDPESLALKLAEYLGPYHDIHTRQECAELLHKLLNDDDLCTWHNLSVSTQSTIKCILLDRMKLEEESKFIIKELCKTIWKLAVSLLPGNNWPELLPFLYQCVSTSGSNNYLRKSAFWIFGTLAKDIGETVAPCIKAWHPLFQNARMDAILGPDSEPFKTFLSDHVDKDSEAKSMFNLMKRKDPESLAIKLSNFLGPSHNLYYRQECAELLHKLLNDDDLCTWRNLSVSTHATIKCILLDCISLEESEFIIGQLRYIIYKLGASILPNNNWPELLPFLCRCVNNPNSNTYLKESAFWMFAELAEGIGQTIVPYIKELRSKLLNTLNDDTLHLDLRAAATKAAITFIQCIPNPNEKERFQDLLPGMMSTLTDALSNSREEDSAQYVLGFFVDLAKKEPRFLRTQLVVVVGSILDIAEDEKLDEETRRLAVKFLIKLVEARERIPGMVKRLPLFISRCFAILLNLLLDIKDDTAWHNAETKYDNTGTTSNYHVGVKYLNRFSLALGGKSIAHIATEQLCAYSAAPEWEKRHAALYALGQIAKGCSKVMIKNLKRVMNMVLKCLRDPYPRVRWAACYAMIQLLKDFSPHLQEQYHKQASLALAKAVDDFKNPRVQASAVVALARFYEFVKPETLIPYLDGIVNKLLVLLQNGKQFVQQQALTELGAVAGYAAEHFGTYYVTVMPHLKTILRNADLKSDLILRAKAIECISFVGFAGGKEKFREDAEQIMEVIISLQGLQAKANGPPIKSLLLACTRICHCLQQEFLPYMSAVMAFFIKCAQLEPAMSTQKDQDVLRVKANACDMIRYCASILKEEFHPWISQLVSIFVPLLNFYIDNSVKVPAVKAMSVLLYCAKLAVEKGIAHGGSESYFKELSDSIIPALVEALHKEHVTKICAIMLGELNNCLQICGRLPNEGQIRSIVNEIKHVITESSSRKQEFTTRAKMENFDAEEVELLREERNQEEEEVIKNVGEILFTLIKAFKTEFLCFLDELSSYLLPMLAKEKTTKERYTSIRIFVELVVECPKAAIKYYEACLPLILDASNDEDPYVRMNALYGIRVWAKYDRSSFKPFIGAALSRINVVIMHLNALKPENECAYNYAVSALGKMCQYHGESIDSSAQVIQAWLNCLPIKANLYEAKRAHEQLCSMTERSDRELLGPNYQYLPKVVSVFAEILCSDKDLATEETTKRMISVLRHLEQTLPRATFESSWSYLLPQQEMKLKSIISPEEDINF